MKSRRAIRLLVTVNLVLLLEEYLLKGAGAGAQWAQLLLASRLETSESQKALGLYLDVAQTDNCHAQARVAKAHYAGVLLLHLLRIHL